ncbi:MAG: hypothetical protein ACFFDN_52325, partial [Candidatus Hodarchaeota archaeon]
MVNNQINKIQIKNTLFRFINLNPKKEEFNIIKDNILGNIKNKASQFEKRLVRRIINYRNDMETDFYDKNIIKSICHNDKQRFKEIIQSLLNKKILLEKENVINKMKIKKFYINPKLKKKPMTLNNFIQK